MRGSQLLLKTTAVVGILVFAVVLFGTTGAQARIATAVGNGAQPTPSHSSSISGSWSGASVSHPSAGHLTLAEVCSHPVLPGWIPWLDRYSSATDSSSVSFVPVHGYYSHFDWQPDITTSVQVRATYTYDKCAHRFSSDADLSATSSATSPCSNGWVGTFDDFCVDIHNTTARSTHVPGLINGNTAFVYLNACFQVNVTDAGKRNLNGATGTIASYDMSATVTFTYNPRTATVKAGTNTYRTPPRYRQPC